MTTPAPARGFPSFSSDPRYHDIIAQNFKYNNFDHFVLKSTNLNHNHGWMRMCFEWLVYVTSTSSSSMRAFSPRLL